MESQKESIIRTLFEVARKHQKAYCYPSQGRIVQLLGKYHALRISRRTLNRRLSELEAEGYFTRTRRHRQGKNGGMIFASTLYRLGGRAFNWLYGLGSLAGRLFSFYRVPKLAQYKRTSARDLASCGSLGGLITQALQKGGPSGTSSKAFPALS